MKNRGNDYTNTNSELKKELLGKKNLFKQASLTNNIVDDFFHGLDYIPLSLNEEISCIKKAQLSFYDDVSDEKKREFFENYMSEFPHFKERYESSSYEEKEILLEKAIDNSFEWRDWFITNNQRLILTIALHYKERCEKTTLMDLVQEGNLGLMRALEKYNFSLENKFSSYAVHWIRQNIGRSIAEKDATIRQPVHFYEKARKIAQAEKDLYQKLHRNPSAREIAKETGLEEYQVIYIQEYRTFQANPASLNMIVGEEDTELGEIVVSKQKSPDKEAEENILNEQFMEILNNCGLNVREREIIFMRYGFGDRKISTLKEIGEYFEITKSRVQQIESSALKRLSLNDELRKLYPEKIKKIKINR